jgi:ribosome-associated toxin RatA of RatAB toxin-antitoxin module
MSRETFLLLEGNWDFLETDFEKMIKFRVKYKMIQRESRISNFGLWGGRIRPT